MHGFHWNLFLNAFIILAFNVQEINTQCWALEYNKSLKTDKNPYIYAKGVRAIKGTCWTSHPAELWKQYRKWKEIWMIYKQKWIWDLYQQLYHYLEDLDFIQWLYTDGRILSHPKSLDNQFPLKFMKFGYLNSVGGYENPMLDLKCFIFLLIAKSVLKQNGIDLNYKAGFLKVIFL